MVVAAVLSAGAGCAPIAEPQSPDRGLKLPVHPPLPPDLGRGAPRVEIGFLNVYTGVTIHQVCSGPDPFFTFDSAKPSSDDQPTMHNLASCMISGALRLRSIKLTGRTDPRGSEEYNEALGLKRAERVKTYLVSQGIAPARIETASLGKEDASPTPSEWPQDRRVGVELVP